KSFFDLLFTAEFVYRLSRKTSSNDQVPPSQYTGNSVGGVLVKKSSTDDDCLVEENNRSEVISSTEDSKPKRTDEPIRRVRVRLTTTEPRKVVCITRTLSNPASRTRIADSSRLVLVPSVHRGDYGGIERKPFRQSVMEKTHPSGVESAKEETSQADHLFIDSSLRDEANESNPGLSSTPKDADTISGTVLENPDEAENPSDSVSETEHLVRNSVSDTDAGVEPQTVKQLLPADDAQSSVGEACDEDKTCTTGSTANICFVRSCLRRSSSFTAPRYGVERLPPYRPTRKVSQVPDANKPSSLSNNGPVIPVPGIQPGFDIAHLTESALRDLYEPFDTYRAQIVRQARDIFVCSYFGDLSKFDEEFLKPAAELLKKFKESTLNSFTQEGKQGFGFGWPLCHNDHILVHLGEGESRTVLLPGDIYLYVCDGCTSTNVGLKAKIKTQDNANVADIVIDESHFAHVFTMDWPSTASSSMSELCEIVFELNSLVTCVERGIDRLRWQSAVLCPPNFDVQSYDCLSEKRNSLSKSSASMSNNYQCQKSKEKSASDSNDTTTDVDDDGYHDDDPGLIHQISSLSQLDSAMLHTGNVILPGCRDVDGRAVAFIS
ncbi:PLEKHG4 (predicted), partial [Pycnogonum litorale]